MNRLSLRIADPPTPRIVCAPRKVVASRESMRKLLHAIAHTPTQVAHYKENTIGYGVAFSRVEPRSSVEDLLSIKGSSCDPRGHDLQAELEHSLRKVLYETPPELRVRQ
jgi:hypothetical protein